MRLRDAQKIVLELVGTDSVFIDCENHYRKRDGSCQWTTEWCITWFAWDRETSVTAYPCRSVKAPTLAAAVEKLQALALERRQQQIDEAGSELQGDQERAGIACGERDSAGRLT